MKRLLLVGICMVGLSFMACQEDTPVNALGQTEADTGTDLTEADMRRASEDDTGSNNNNEPTPDLGNPDPEDLPTPEPDLPEDLPSEPDLPEDEPDLVEDEPDDPIPPRSGMAPMPRPYSGAACPVITGGPTSAESVNEGFASSDQARSFRFIIPSSYDGSQPMPLMFAWHWLNASSNSFVEQGELESTAEQMGFLVVLPDKRRREDGGKAFLFDWPFAEDWGAEDELVFFDDLLHCIDEQYNVDLNRVYGVGVSAGALWLTYLSTTDRVDHLAAVVSLSGGLGDVFGAWSMEFVSQPNKFPAIVLWGGPSDWLGVNFAQASMDYQQELMDDGHFVIQCIHDSGHTVPPIDPPNEETTRFVSLWQFMLDHPYGTPAGTSPYQQTGLPPFMPEWCSIVTP